MSRCTLRRSSRSGRRSRTRRSSSPSAGARCGSASRYQVRRPSGTDVDEAAPAQAGELVGHHLPGDPERVGEVRRVGGRLSQRQQDPGPGLVGQCMSEPSQGRGMGGSRRGHPPYGTRICVLSRRWGRGLTSPCHRLVAAPGVLGSRSGRQGEGTRPRRTMMTQRPGPGPRAGAVWPVWWPRSVCGPGSTGAAPGPPASAESAETRTSRMVGRAPVRGGPGARRGRARPGAHRHRGRTPLARGRRRGPVWSSPS